VFIQPWVFTKLDKYGTNGNDGRKDGKKTKEHLGWTKDLGDDRLLQEIF